jgi:YD repeat-containing protein
MKKLLLSVSCLSCLFLVTAQTDAPKLILPSPEAFSLTKYGDIPIGLFTGTMNYSVSLMQLQAGKITIPISLEYATNGIKVNEVSGRTGMGWNLRAGGVITRNIIGKADDQLLLTAPPAYDTSSIYFYNYMKSVAETAANTQPDEFTYSFMGYSGKFYYDFSGNIKQLTLNGIKIVSTDTLKTFKVTTPDGVQYYFGGLTSCDYTDSYNLYVEEDPLYTYGQGGRTAWYLTKIKHPSGDSVLFNYSWVSNSLATPIEYVSNIQQTMTVATDPFGFVGNWYISSGSCTYPGTLVNSGGEGYPAASCASYGTVTTYSVSKMSVVKLDEIIFKQGILRFYYSDRDDVPGEQKLDSLVLFSKPGNVRVKKTGFIYNYTTSSSTYHLPLFYTSAFYGSTAFQDNFSYLKKRLFLDTLSFVAVNNDIESQSYAFNYDGRDNLPARLSFAQDLFGYFNGKASEGFCNNNTFLNPFIGGSVGAAGNRDVDTAYTKNGVLSKITYPTGGFTKISYENNYIIGGERKIFDTVITEITAPATTPVVYSSAFNCKIPFKFTVTASYVTPPVYDPMAPVVDTSVLVRIEDASTGECLAVCNMPVNPGDAAYQRYYWALRGTENHSSIRVKLETTNPNVKAIAEFIYYESVSYVHNKPSGGVRVATIQNFSSNGHKGSHKRFFYNNPSDSLSSGALINDFQDGRDFAYIQRSGCTSPEFTGANYVLSSSSSLGGFSNDYLSVNYEYVTEYNDSLGTGGAIQTRFLVQNNQLPLTLSCVASGLVDMFSPRLIPGVPYSNTGILNGKEFVKTIYKNNSGSFVKIKETKNYYSVDSRLLHTDSIYVIRKPYTRSVYDVGVKYYSDFDLNIYKRISAWPHLDSVVQKDFDTDSHELTVKTEYTYANSDHLQQTKVKTIKSNGDQATTSIRYAHDLSLSSLVGRNFIAVPILSKDSVNSTQVAQQKTGYALWGNNIAPDSVMRAKGNNALEADLIFTIYDPNSNPLEFTVHSQASALLVDTALNLMIAGCQNAPYGSIAAASFESNYKGNWDYTSAGSGTANGAVTGNRAYTLSTGNIERTSLNTSQTYVVTYWLKNSSGTATVNSAAGTALVNKNGWTLYQKEITGTTTVTISGSGVIDELRLYPKNAQMTTYTYEPLVGITTQCDVNNRITYYEYDSFGRLLRIRDHDRNILKSFNYTYQEVQ